MSVRSFLHTGTVLGKGVAPTVIFTSDNDSSHGPMHTDPGLFSFLREKSSHRFPLEVLFLPNDKLHHDV